MQRQTPDEPRNPDPRQQHEADPAEQGQAQRGKAPEHFRREGPEPAQGDTGRTIDEMNEAAEASVINNVTPDEAVD